MAWNSPSNAANSIGERCGPSLKVRWTVSGPPVFHVLTTLAEN